MLKSIFTQQIWGVVDKIAKRQVKASREARSRALFDDKADLVT